MIMTLFSIDSVPRTVVRCTVSAQAEKAPEEGRFFAFGAGACGKQAVFHFGQGVFQGLAGAMGGPGIIGTQGRIQAAALRKGIGQSLFEGGLLLGPAVLGHAPFQTVQQVADTGAAHTGMAERQETEPGPAFFQQARSSR